MIKTIIFDFDGTIGDTFSLSLDKANEYAKERGWKQLKNTKSLRDKSAAQLLKEHPNINLITLPGFVATLKKRVAKEFDTVKTFKGMKKVIETLRKKYKVGILTSNSSQNVKKVLKKEGIKYDFLVSDSSIFGKHIVLKKLLNKRKLKHHEVVYVGDEVRDVNSCIKIGINVMAVTWGFNSKKALSKAKPTFVVDKPAEILKILR
jgi:phosphoglycolate phosphatase